MTSEQFLSRLEGVKPTSAGWQARCPAHDDRNASLSVAEGASGKILVKCHAGCSTEAVLAAMGLKLADLFERRNGDPAHGHTAKRIVATYPYHDEAGKLLFEVVRFNPKDFRQRRPDPAGKDAWAWNTKGVRRVPFRLPELVKAVNEARTIYVAEGEKDVLALVKAGFAGTCNPGGAGKWLPEYVPHFELADVVVVADKDEPGRKHAQQVAASLHGAAASVRVIEVPDVGKRTCKDAADFFSVGGQAADLDELVQGAPEWTPPQRATGSDATNEGEAAEVESSTETEPLRILAAGSFDEFTALRDEQLQSPELLTWEGCQVSAFSLRTRRGWHSVAAGGSPGTYSPVR